MTRLSALLGSLAVAAVAAPAPAAADVGEEHIIVTAGLELGFFGDVLSGQPTGDDTEYWNAKSNPTLGVGLRLEVPIGRFVSLGVAGTISWFRIGRDAYLGPTLPEPILVDFDEDRHALAGTDGFLRLRYPLGDGTAEYYILGGAGAGFLPSGDDPNEYGAGISGGNQLGWTAFARMGVRGELMPGFGAMVEIGWVHREHHGAFDVFMAEPAPGTVTSMSYVTNQVSLWFGWYFAR